MGVWDVRVKWLGALGLEESIRRMLATEPKGRPLRGEYGRPAAWGWWGTLAGLGRALSSRGTAAGESTAIATTPDGSKAAPAGAGLAAPACDAPPHRPGGGRATRK